MSDTLADWEPSLVPPSQLDAYYRQALDEQAQQDRRTTRKIRFAYAVTGVALVIALVEGAAISAMQPLQRAYPIVVVEHPDGTYDATADMSRLPATQNQAVLEATLLRFVFEAEGFIAGNEKNQWGFVAALADEPVWQAYKAKMSAAETKKYTKAGQIDVEKISVLPEGPHLYHIRFRKLSRVNIGDQPVATTWAAIIGYRQVTEMPAADRIKSPGGYKVTAYQSRQETP